MSGAGRRRCFRRDAIVSTWGENRVFEVSPNGSGSEGGEVCKYPGTQAPPPRVGIVNNASVEEAADTCTGDLGNDADGILPGERGDGGADEMTNPSNVPERGLGNPLGGLVSSGQLSAASNNGRHSPASSSSA